MAAMTCEDARDLFSARVDDALADDERAPLQAHLATCAACAREWDRFERTVALLRAAEPARAPAGFVDRVLAARPGPWYRRLARALLVPWPVKLPLEAAAVVLVAGLAIVVFQRSPELQQAARAPAPPAAVSTPPTDARATPPPVEPGASLPAAPPGPPVGSAAPTPAAPPAPPVGAPAPMPAVPPAPASPPAPSAADAPVAEPSQRRELAARDESRPRAAESERAAARQAAPSGTAPKSSEVARVAAAAEVHARLAVTDRAAAERGVGEVVASAGGRVAAREDADGATVLILTIAAERWDEVTRGLGALGTLRVDGRPPGASGPVRLTLRLER
jgi:hypothetical protein